MGVALIEKT